MAVWHETLNLRDVFHNDDMEFEVKRDEIVKRITSLRLFDEDDLEVLQIVEALGDAEDEDEFDEYWNDFYDWADGVRVWVATF